MVSTGSTTIIFAKTDFRDAIRKKIDRILNCMKIYLVRRGEFMFMAKKNLAQSLFLGLFAIMSFGFLSCSSEANQHWTFDDEQFNYMNQKWKDAEIKNYTFEYSISDVTPDSVIGNMTVSDGAGSGELFLCGLKPCDENYSSELERYSDTKIEFKTIDELYDFIKTTVKSRKISYDNKELTIYSLEIDYDEQNFIPLRINESLVYSERTNKEISEGFWDGSLDIKITNFQVN